MKILEDILNSTAGHYIIMITVVLLFVGTLRFLYGPKGIWRKNLWDGIEDDEQNKKKNDEQN